MLNEQVGATGRLAAYLGAFFTEDPDVELVRILLDGEFRAELPGVVLGGHDAESAADFFYYDDEDELAALQLVDRAWTIVSKSGPCSNLELLFRFLEQFGKEQARLSLPEHVRDR